MSKDLINFLKKEARFIAVRALVEDGLYIQHGKALESLAHEMGFKDWNELRLIASTEPRVVMALLGIEPEDHFVETDDEFENRGNRLSRTGDE